MAIEQRLHDQLRRLIGEAEELLEAQRQHQSIPRQYERGIGWLVAAEHLVSLICQHPSDPYRASLTGFVASAKKELRNTHLSMGQAAAVLERLENDIDRGLIASVAMSARAETLDDLLEQAKEYHRRGHQEGSGILATAIYEDTIRRIARVKQIGDPHGPAEQIIIELTKAGVITGVTANRCRTASRVRNSALHAKWGEYTLADVDEVLRITGQLLSDHLDG